MSNCSCIFDDYGDYPDVYDKQERKARKKHVCEECSKKINIGDKYLYQTCLIDGDWEHQKICLDCFSIIKAFFCSWEWGTVLERINEYIIDIKGEVASEQLLKLTPKAREYVFNKIDNIFEELNKDEL